MATTAVPHPHHATTAQYLAGALGAVFLLVGVAGFIPGITTHVSDMKFAGHDSPSELLGIFQVSVLHNIVHLLFGVLGLVFARSRDAATTYLIGGGIVYLVITLYGVLVDLGEDGNFVPVNNADNWLHLGLGVTMIVLGLATRERRATRVDDPARAGTR